MLTFVSLLASLLSLDSMLGLLLFTKAIVALLVDLLGVGWVYYLMAKVIVVPLAGVCCLLTVVVLLATWLAYLVLTFC